MSEWLDPLHKDWRVMMQSVQRQSNMYGLLREKDHPTYKCNDGVYEYIHCNAKTGTETNVRRVTPGISCNITEN